MAQKGLIIGDSGTGKTCSIRNCDPKTTAIISPEKAELPFRVKEPFSMLVGETDSAVICDWMKKQARNGKKLIVVDDFQYILCLPFMRRIQEKGWDKFNDFGKSYFDTIEVCKELPDDVVVMYLTHGETLQESGLYTVKLVGKVLREKLTVEGMFAIVLRTAVQDGHYYFLTQNGGHDTVKSPMGMFPSFAIDNNLAYVADKIRNYYGVDGAKTDAEMEQEDAHVAANEVQKDTPRRARNKRRTHDQVVAENEKKAADYLDEVDKAIDKATGGKEEVPFEDAVKAAETVPAPDMEKPPRRTRKERQLQQAESPDDFTADQGQNVEVVTLAEDGYFYDVQNDNYVRRHAGDTVTLKENGTELMRAITREEFVEGCKALSKDPTPQPQVDETNGMPVPEDGGRRARRPRRTRA